MVRGRHSRVTRADRDGAPEIGTRGGRRGDSPDWSRSFGSWLNREARGFPTRVSLSVTVLNAAQAVAANFWSRATRSAVGGCVENNFEMPRECAANGFTCASG